MLIKIIKIIYKIINGARDGDRTRDNRYHKPALYQLSYSRHKMARLAGLEPATLGLEIRCSIQMSYRRIMVGVEGFEPPTSCSQSRRATRLRYTPNYLYIIRKKRITLLNISINRHDIFLDEWYSNQKK